RCTVHASEDIEIIIGDQGSEEFWDDFISKKLNFDIIIDDGSHENAHQILTLKKTYNLLNNGGIYWCEDTHTSYYNCRVQGGGYLNPKSFTEYAKSVIDVLSEHHTHYAIGVGHTINNRHVDPELVLLYNQIQGIHFYDSIVVIEKGPRLHFQRILNSGKTL
ncbi:MAG: hypothetical protein N2235_18245, partial [Fischerella sp.]|nr:hypothetical protein [Fischerella sp.]